MSETQPEGSLRERKKAKTRAAIQHEALRLFSEQGYGATTIEQIVDAVEVSQSTFFRYFPAKEDLVLTDDYDPIIIEAIRTQPPDLGPIEAVRRGLRAVFDPLSDEERADMRGRARVGTLGSRAPRGDSRSVCPDDPTDHRRHCRTSWADGGRFRSADLGGGDSRGHDLSRVPLG